MKFKVVEFYKGFFGVQVTSGDKGSYFLQSRYGEYSDAMMSVIDLEEAYAAGVKAVRDDMKRALGLLAD